jgi:hypothetical protein
VAGKTPAAAQWPESADIAAAGEASTNRKSQSFVESNSSK